MPSYIGIGFSKNPDDLTAAQEAVEEARRQLGAGRVDLALVYHTVHYNPREFLPYIYTSLDKTRLAGTSTAALVLSHGIEEQGIAVLALRSDLIKFEVAHISHLHYQDIFTAGKQLASDCVTEFGARFRKLLIFYVNGLNPYMPQLIEGLKEQLGHAFPIYGAGSSDALMFKKTYQLYQDKYLTDGVVGLVLGGTLEAGISVKHGWLPLGKPRTIDAVSEGERHIIHQIDGKKATALYEEYFGEEAATLGHNRLGLLNTRYPLGLAGDGRNDYIIRNIIGTLDDGSIVCQDKVDKGARVHIMLGGKESCLLATQAAANEAKTQLSRKKPELILVFESLLRYKLLKRSLGEELSVIKNTFGESVPIFGMFSMNEIFTPRHFIQEKARTDIQNGCIMIAAIL